MLQFFGMALKRNMTRDEMVAFIDSELLPQAKLEIQNWIRPKKRQGGYFVTVRQILCMVDFLGAAYWGYPLSERKPPRPKKPMQIARSEKAIKFITTFFEPKQTYQLSLVEKLHNMYRHGLVHLYQPKILKYINNSTLEWFFYKGKRIWLRKSADTNQGKIVFKKIDHLKIIPRGTSRKRYHLAVCIDALYEDFENAVLKYRDKLSKTKSLQRKWRTTVNAICKPQ